MNTAVEVQGLTKRYGDLVAVDNVTFAIEKGEVFGLLGPNGAGKTTLVEMIEGLRKPDGGSIRLMDIDALKERGRTKEMIGVQLQSTSIYDHIRVDEAVSLFGSYYRKSVPASQLFDEVSLNDKKSSLVQYIDDILYPLRVETVGKRSRERENVPGDFPSLKRNQNPLADRYLISKHQWNAIDKGLPDREANSHLHMVSHL